MHMLLHVLLCIVTGYFASTRAQSIKTNADMMENVAWCDKEEHI